MSNEYEINRTPAPQGFEAVINRLIADAEEQKKGTSRTLELTALGGMTQWLGGMLNAYRIWEGQSGNPTTTNRTVAVEPSCVVTDEMVEAACAALQADVAKRHSEAQGGWPGRIPEKDLAIARNGMRLALTAALSSRTEEEPSRLFVRDVAKLSLSGEVTDEDEGTIFDPWPNDQHECLEKLIRRARDLKDGGAS